MRKLLVRRKRALLKHLLFVLALCVFVSVVAASGSAQVTIAQISDTHLGEAHSPRV